MTKLDALESNEVPVPQIETSQNTKTRALAWALSLALHVALVGSFVSFDALTVVNRMSSSKILSVDLIATPEARPAVSGNARKAPIKGAYIKSQVAAVQVESAHPEVSDIAARAEAAVLAAAGDSNAPQGLRDAYVLRLRAMIEKNKSYPIRARQLGLSGRVVVSFTILESGRVTDVKVEKPCHHNILNRHAVEIVEHIESFEPIPRELGLSHWHMTVPIEFALN